MIGNNSCGAHSAAYGKTVDNVDALEVILYDGTHLSLTGSTDEAQLAAAIARGGLEGELYSRLRELRDQTADSVRAHFPKLPRRVSGYNLDQLMRERGFNLARAIVGSEGTLATILRATIRAAPRPNEVGLAVLGFDDVFIAADQTPWLLEHHPEALEGFDQNLPEFARIKKMPGVRFLPAGRAFLLVEMGGASRDEARERAERVIAAGARAARMHRRRIHGRRARSSRGLADSRVGAGLERVYPGPSAQLARRRGFRGAAGQPRRVSARLRSDPQHPQSQGRDLLRTLRRRMRSRARQFRFDERIRHRDVPRRDGRARRTRRESRRFALGRAWRRAGALRVAADDVPARFDRRVPRFQAYLRSHLNDESRE